jgi:hypothetical protein
MKGELRCHTCRQPMRLTRETAQQLWFRCDACKRNAYKDDKGAHYLKDKARPRKPQRRTKPLPERYGDPYAITAPMDPALDRKPSGWRRKFRRPNE